MSTAQTIIDLGYAKSSAARIETFATDTELLARIRTALREVFQILAREHPTVLGVRQPVAFANGGWQRPANALRVIDVRASGDTQATPSIPAGERITVVPYNDQRVARGVPCLTELGQQFIPTGQAIDPSGGTLTLTMVRAPQPLVTPESPIDPLFPEEFDDLLAADLALYLAGKDAREQDVAFFAQQKNGNVAQMLDWARAQTFSLVQRNTMVTPPVTNTAGGRQQPLAGTG